MFMLLRNVLAHTTVILFQCFFHPLSTYWHPNEGKHSSENVQFINLRELTRSGAKCWRFHTSTIAKISKFRVFSWRLKKVAAETLGSATKQLRFVRTLLCTGLFKMMSQSHFLQKKVTHQQKLFIKTPFAVSPRTKPIWQDKLHPLQEEWRKTFFLQIEAQKVSFLKMKLNSKCDLCRLRRSVTTSSTVAMLCTEVWQHNPENHGRIQPLLCVSYQCSFLR